MIYITKFKSQTNIYYNRILCSLGFQKYHPSDILNNNLLSINKTNFLQMYTRMPSIFSMTYNITLKDKRNVNANRNIHKYKIIKVKIELIFEKAYFAHKM